ncbi:EcsC family protein [Actinomycetes bacterium NPDC127524]
MPLTNREIEIWNEISEWEEKLNLYESTDFSSLYDKWVEQGFSLLPQDKQTQFFSKLDTWLFHLHAMIQSSQIQMDARDRILGSARVFSEDISSIPDLQKLTIDQLNYIADQQIAKYRLYSFAQGGASGSGGILLLGGDFPAMLAINLRIVQLVAMTYGYEVNTPFEMMTALKVFRIGTLPKRLQGAAWAELLQETPEEDGEYFYQGSEDLTDPAWMKLPLNQLLKGAAITLFRKKLFQGIPLISMSIGAGSNYQLTRRVSEFAQKYYQYRYLQRKRVE